MTYSLTKMYPGDFSQGTPVRFLVEGRFRQEPNFGYPHGKVFGKIAVIPDNRPEGESVAQPGDYVSGLVAKSVGRTVYIAVTKNHGCAVRDMIGQTEIVPITGIWSRDARDCISDPGIRGGIKHVQTIIEKCSVSHSMMYPKRRSDFIEQGVMIKSVEKNSKGKSVVRATLADPKSPYMRNRDKDLFIGELGYDETFGRVDSLMNIFNGIPDHQRNVLLVTKESKKIIDISGDYHEVGLTDPGNAIWSYRGQMYMAQELPLILTNSPMVSEIYSDAAISIGLRPEMLLRRKDV